jgi:NAD(P)-dependent dehydrogenase (short-subunit alcohol dehydrogenase family)
MAARTDLIELAGKTALVTGAGKRLGAAVARALGRAGVQVVLHYCGSEGEAAALASELGGLGAQAWTIAADFRDPHAAEALFDAACAQAGPIDFLINSAGVFPEQTLSESTPEAIHANIDVNALAPFLLARRFAAQGREGAVVNFLDTMIRDYDRKHVPYHLSKQMLFSLTRMMAVEFAPNVRVNAVAPGLILPPLGEDDAYLEALAYTNPLQRCGHADGVCEAVLFLLRSGFVTGQVLYIDGGRHMRGNMYG